MEHPIKIMAAGSGSARGTGRDSLFLTALVRRVSDRSERTVRVRNLSAGGMMADSAEIFAEGEPITIELRGVGEIGGRVAWHANEKIGVSFDVQIDPKRARKPVGTGESNTPDHIKPRQTRRPGLRIG